MYGLLPVIVAYDVGICTVASSSREFAIGSGAVSIAASGNIVAYAF